MNAKHVALSELKVGDTFWYFYRGWLVLEELKDGSRRCLCVDDGGEPTLPGSAIVEKLGGTPSSL